jgi:hypothetical protein
MSGWSTRLARSSDVNPIDFDAEEQKLSGLNAK